ncbi:MAG: hypothetical protein HC902_03550 [Calothrix sp. SM1_5_4]|nr:hypothetical protein [Calothrix sp. SM1_5_4]
MIRNLTILMIGIASVWNIDVHAKTLADLNEDVEDLGMEADAAIAETKDVQEKVAQEREAVSRVHQQAVAANRAALSKRQAAIDRWKKAEADIQRMNAERARLLSDNERLDKEAVQADKMTKDSLLRGERLKQEIETIRQVQAEKRKKVSELLALKDKAVLEMQDTEKQHQDAEKELQLVKDDEKRATEQFEKAKLEESQKRARLHAFITSLKERHKAAQERLAAMEREKQQLQKANDKLEAEAKAGEAEVQQVERQLASTGPTGSVGSAGSAAAEELTFKRSCRVFDSPKKGSKVLGTSTSGTSVAKNNEGKTWISFKLSDGRTGYSAKKCFEDKTSLSSL